MLLLATRPPVWAAENSSFTSQLSVDTPVTAEGYFVLSWEDAAAAQDSATLLQSASENFSEALSREVPASGSITITGLEDGQYYFRLQSGQQTLSNTVNVQVAHHSLGRAFGFFIVGALLFAVLIITIVTGRKRTQTS